MTSSPDGYGHRDEILGRILAEIGQGSSASVDVEQYVAQYPDLAAEIRELFDLQNALGKSCPPIEAPLPDVLGDFQIVRRIARGGMGDIYEAVQRPIQRRVAVKTIRQDKSSPTKSTLPIGSPVKAIYPHRLLPRPWNRHSRISARWSRAPIRRPRRVRACDSRPAWPGFVGSLTLAP